MEKYIEIICDALNDALTYQSYYDEINENTTLRIMAVVDVAMSYISKHYFDHHEYEDLVLQINSYKGDNNYIHNMFERLEDYHKESLEECEKDPAWKKFDNGMGSG